MITRDGSVELKTVPLYEHVQEKQYMSIMKKKIVYEHTEEK